MNPTNCRHCGRVSPGHYCRTVAPNETRTCIALAKARNVRASNARVRAQSAALNGGVPLGKSNKALKTRLDFLTIRSYADVAKILGCSAESVRLTELRALEKVKKGLMPFRNATSGAAKVLQVSVPIPSLAD